MLLGLPIWLSAQSGTFPADTTKKGLIIIDHFGKLVEDLQGAEAAKWISNGLQLRIDSTNIYADSAVIFNEDRVFAYGNVVIQQGDSLEVFTDTLYYTREEDVAELVGEVALRQGRKQLWTKNLSYHLGERYGEYHQGGTLVDQDLQVTSRRGIYYADREEVKFQDSVIVLHSAFNLAADSMRYLADSAKVLFTGPTNIYTDKAKIYCESGYYDLAKKVSEFNRHAQYVEGRKSATADTIRYLSDVGVVHMLGHVVVEEGIKHITGSALHYVERTGETRILGDPAFYKDSTRTVHSPEIRYNAQTDQVTTIGRGQISDDNWVMIADQSNYDQATGLGTAEGNVMWSDTSSDVGLHTDIMKFSKKDEFVLAYGIHRPWFYSLVDGDTLYIAADTLNMWNEYDTTGTGDTIRMIRAYHHVLLFKSDMQGRTDSLVFHGRDSLFTFYGEPLLWSDSSQFSADTITLTLRDKRIHRITLLQRALIISEIMKTFYDQIKGRTILAQFDSSEVKDMWVAGNAESIYYAQDDQKAFIGVNKTICRKMHFTFLSGQIEWLKYFGENTSQFLPMSEADHRKLRLEGFAWRESERPLTFDDLLK